MDLVTLILLWLLTVSLGIAAIVAVCGGRQPRPQPVRARRAPAAAGGSPRERAGPRCRPTRAR